MYPPAGPPSPSADGPPRPEFEPAEPKSPSSLPEPPEPPDQHGVVPERLRAVDDPVQGVIIPCRRQAESPTHRGVLGQSRGPGSFEVEDLGPAFGQVERSFHRSAEPIT